VTSHTVPDISHATSVDRLSVHPTQFAGRLLRVVIVHGCHMGQNLGTVQTDPIEGTVGELVAERIV
jgi:hypothetical protein